jgi:hypothetical protein
LNIREKELYVKKPDEEVQKVIHLVDFASTPSFEIMGIWEITKREERVNQVVRRLRETERYTLLPYWFFGLQSVQNIAKPSSEAFWVTKKVSPQF